MTSLDYSAWPSKPEAARALGIGERTLDRRIARTGAPEVRMRPRNNGRKPEPVCNPEDVQRILQERSKAVAIPQSLVPSVALARPVDDTAGIARVLEAVAAIAHGREPALWLTLKQAAAYSGLSMALLQRMANSGAINAVKDNGWKIRRAALESLDLTCALDSLGFRV